MLNNFENDYLDHWYRHLIPAIANDDTESITYQIQKNNKNQFWKLVFDLLPKINIPTLIFHCEEDARVPLNEASILHENIKNSEFVQLDSRNHIILKTDPGWSTFVRKLQDFIKKLDVKLHW